MYEIEYPQARPQLIRETIIKERIKKVKAKKKKLAGVRKVLKAKTTSRLHALFPKKRKLRLKKAGNFWGGSF